MVRRQPCMLDTAYCTVLPSPLTVSFSVTGCERYAPIARPASYPACMALGGSLRRCLKRRRAGLAAVGSDTLLAGCQSSQELDTDFVVAAQDHARSKTRSASSQELQPVNVCRLWPVHK